MKKFRKISAIIVLELKIINELPERFMLELKTEIIISYILALPKSLNKRMLKQELRSKGHGTFRSIGAVLGFRPDKGSPI